MTLKPNVVKKPCSVENCHGTMKLKWMGATTWTCDTCGHSEPYPPGKIKLRHYRELWFDDSAAMDRVTNHAAWLHAFEDAERFADLERSYPLIAEERVIID